MPTDPIGLKDVFSEALARTVPAERAAYLAAACGDDAELRSRVEALIRASDEPDSLLDAPLQDPADVTGTFRPEPQQMGTAEFRPDGATETFDETPRREHSPATTLGEVIAGRYTLVEVIGEGGMGSVYLASQSEPVKRQVALKLIKSGMDSKGVLARFDAERQALALMDHPNIARIYDGGLTPTGQPFFVMELVQGVPLTDYCDANRLTVDARLQLFVSVCQAVQHAHQKGIIHRDLKPGNVLVTEVDGRPTPKIIDFGVAKATELKLTDMSFADTGAIVGTPAYMSPEQADPSSMDIDTRTDVYALGVILYELLTGTPPIDSKQFKRGAILEMLRIVREVDPPRPSTKLSEADARPNIAASRSIEPAKLAKLLQGELDWVVMKALEKDRTRRYETANGFAADIQRYLADEVVEARPPSAGYRLKKFIRRNKGQVIAASLILFALLGGIAGTTLGLIEARSQENEARAQEKIARDETAEKEKARADEAERVKERDAALMAEGVRVKERDAALKAEGERADELNHRLGTSAMVLANAAYDNRDFKLATERLDAVPTGQRGWEWRHLKRQLNGGIFTLFGHGGPVQSVAFSPDGTRVVTGCGGGQEEPFEAKVWDAGTGTLLFELKGLPPANAGYGGSVMRVAYSPDGTRIVTGGGDSKTRVWDAATGALRLELNEPVATVLCAAFSPDSTRIATGAATGLNGFVKVWDAKTGEPVRHWKAHRNGVTQLVFSPDGARIITGGHDGAVRVWDAATGASLLEVKSVQSGDGGLAVSPDGKRIVAGQLDASARVIDAQSGKTLLVLRGRPQASTGMMVLPRGVLGAAFSPDGTRIVTVGAPVGLGSGESIVWDARTGTQLLELQGHSGSVASVAFSPDGQRIITGGFDTTAKMWDTRTGTPRLELTGINSPVESTAMSADARWIVTGGGTFNQPGEAAIWDARTGQRQFALAGLKGIGPVRSVAITPDGTRMVTGGGTGRFRGGPMPKNPKADVGEATVWDARTGNALMQLKGLKEAVGSVAISPDGTRVVSAGFGGIPAGPGTGAELKVWDAVNGALLFDLSQPVQKMGGLSSERGGCVAFNSDGSRFVTGGVRHTNSHGDEVKVWETRTGQALVTIKVDSSVLGVAFDMNGARIATAHDNKTAVIRDAATGAALVELKGHTGPVNSVAFSPDGKRVVTGSMDQTVRVWDARTGTTLAELKSRSGAVSSASFSADGSRLLTSARRTDGKATEVIVWDAPIRASGVELAGHTSPIEAAVLSPDGTRVATASVDGTVRLWDARTGRTLHELKGFKPGLNRLAFSADGKRFATGGNCPVVKVWNAGTGTELLELKTGPHKNLAFSVDGTRIVTEGFEQVKKVWDARTGEGAEDQTIPKTVPAGQTSSDGRWFLCHLRDRIEVISLLPDAEELADRRLHTQPNTARYRTGYLAARLAQDDFAAAFSLKLVPPGEHKAILEQADADGFAALNNLAQEYMNTGRRDEAIPVLVELLAINKAKSGADAPATIQAMDQLGMVHFQTGQFEKAISLFEGVVKVRKAKPDPQAPYAMMMLGLAFEGAGRFKEAVSVLEEAAAKEPGLRQQLLDVCALAGEHPKIVAMCREQLEILRMAKDEGELAFIKADLQARLGRALLAQKKWADAEPHLRECLTAREKNSPDEWPTSETRSLLGESLMRQKKYAEAEPLLVKGYSGVKQWEYSLEPRDEPRIPEALDRLIEFYTATNKPDDVKKWQAERAKHPLQVAPLPREKK